MFACLRACDSGFLPPRQLRLANLNVECLVFGRAELELKRRVARFVTEWPVRGGPGSATVAAAPAVRS